MTEFTKHYADQIVVRKRIRSLRRQHGLRQWEVSAKIGMPRGSYARLEAGYLVIRAKQLEALSKLYGEKIRP